MRPRSVLSSVLAAAALSVSGVACSGESDKSGGDAAPTTTLKLATPEGRGAPYADSVVEFARQVEQLSDGSLRLQIIWEGAERIAGRVWPQSRSGDGRVGAKREAGVCTDSRACLGRAGRDEPAGAAGALPRLDRGTPRTDRAGRAGGGDAGRSRQGRSRRFDAATRRLAPPGSGSRDRSSRRRTLPEQGSARHCPMPHTASWRRWRRNRSTSAARSSRRQSPRVRSTEQSRASRGEATCPSRTRSPPTSPSSRR